MEPDFVTPGETPKARKDDVKLQKLNKEPNFATLQTEPKVQKEGVKLNLGTPERVHYVKPGMSNKEQCLETLEQMSNVQKADVNRRVWRSRKRATENGYPFGGCRLWPFRRLGVPRSKKAGVCLKPVRPAPVRSVGIRTSRV
jgi:hypothetical protein